MKYLTVLIVLLFTLSAYAEDRFARVEVTTIPVRDNVYMLMGAGGNIGVSVGKDGVLIVDDQYAPLSARIRAALKELGNDSPAYVLNTHYHGDHTGGNINFGTAALIIAHENVRVRLLGGEQALPPHALPMLTYQQQASLYFNGEEIRLVHLPSGHTDGDSIVWFTGANVVHMGDHFFRDRFPYVDLDAGGSIDGMIRNIEKALSAIRDDTLVIPGHGKLAGREDLVRYHEMLVATAGFIRSAMAAGRTQDDLLKDGLPDRWQSWGSGFINETRWIQTLYRNYSQ